MAYEGTIYTQEELQMDGVWDSITEYAGKAADVIKAAQGAPAAGAGTGAGMIGPGYQPSFMQKHGVKLALLGGAGVLLFFLLRKKK